MIGNVKSFGRYPKVSHRSNQQLVWLSDNPDFSDEKKYLAIGMNKSYGDSCLNPEANLISTTYMNRIISFDFQNGLLKVESGTTLSQCIDFLMPRGWFLPVTPGTKLITVGGALANDVHGKNHHVKGTFGCHVTQFELLRSDSSRMICSRSENTKYYEATIGGLGLTGIITWVEFRCVRCSGPVINMDSIKFRSLEQFYDINEESKDYEYTVSWLDTNTLNSGIFTRGNFAENDMQIEFSSTKKTLPFLFELEVINPLTVNMFNTLYYARQLDDYKQSYSHFEPFFYPLDKVDGWNKAYGKKGFLQYQFVIPLSAGINALKAILKTIVSFGNSSFLTVLKTFGDIKSPGMLSFPREGITVAIDFKMTGNTILDRLNKSDEIVKSVGGVLYPAKDARMSPASFQEFYPQWNEFSKLKDPKFTSGFWERVTRNIL